MSRSHVRIVHSFGVDPDRYKNVINTTLTGMLIMQQMFRNYLIFLCKAWMRHHSVGLDVRMRRDNTLQRASSYDLGAVGLLLQKEPYGELRSVAYYATRAMSGVEQRYVQIEKETLATLWACERYCTFIIIETDHKPLVSLLGQKTLD